jgi:hypothetical protein
MFVRPRVEVKSIERHPGGAHRDLNQGRSNVAVE